MLCCCDVVVVVVCGLCCSCVGCSCCGIDAVDMHHVTICLADTNAYIYGVDVASVVASCVIHIHLCEETRHTHNVVCTSYRLSAFTPLHIHYVTLVLLLYFKHQRQHQYQ